MNTAEKVVKQVEAALEHDPQVGFHKHPLRIALDPDGALLLEGEVENIRAKKLALEHAAAVPGVIGIVDRVRVARSRQMGDSEIRDHVREALMQESAIDGCSIRVMDSGHWVTFRRSTVTPPCSIDVAVDGGVVTLDGQVNSLSHKRLAGELAWWVPGSRDVVNGLEVLPAQEDNDGEIAEVVKLVLEKDPLVNAARIRITVHNAIVTFEGLVTNDIEREMAEMDAWYVFGVDGVANRLECET